MKRNKQKKSLLHTKQNKTEKWTSYTRTKQKYYINTQLIDTKKKQT